MAKKLASVGPSVCAEHLLMKLAPLVGRGQAHDIVHHALESGGADAPYTDSNIIAHFSESQFETALDPLHYLRESVEVLTSLPSLPKAWKLGLKKRELNGE